MVKENLPPLWRGQIFLDPEDLIGEPSPSCSALGGLRGAGLGNLISAKGLISPTANNFLCDSRINIIYFS